MGCVRGFVFIVVVVVAVVMLDVCNLGFLGCPTGMRAHCKRRG